MQRPIFYLFVFCILCTIALIGYTQWATPTPPPATAVPATATSQPTATPTTAPTTAPSPVLTTDHIALFPFTLALTAPWPVLRPTDAAWQSQLQQLAANQPRLAHYLAALATTPSLEKSIALTWPPAPSNDLVLAAAVTPADGLTLQSYLAALQEELAQSRLLLGAAVTLKRAEIRYDLRQDHRPVATVHYTLPATQNTAGTGYQAVMIDKTGTQLLLLTTVTTDPNPAPMLALLDAIVATIQEE